MPADGLKDRLLSHRLRGFDVRDSTCNGLERALAAGVHHVEFDVRVTGDGHPIAYHDPFFKADDGTWQYIDAWDLAALRAQQVMKGLATLDEMCVCFAAHRGPDCWLHVDVKVAGHEQCIRDTLEKFQVLAETILVSWLPSVLLRFNALSPQTRLCFSHLSMDRAPWLYSVLERIYPAVEPIAASGLRGMIGPAITALAPQLFQDASSVCLHFHDDGDPAAGVGNDRVRFNHGHLVRGTLTGNMLALLQQTQGMVCLPIPLATATLARAYRSQGIGLAVFSVASEWSLARTMAKVDPDIVYVDNAALFAAPSR
jgi:hypothetical protein